MPLQYFAMNQNGKPFAILCAADFTMAELFITGQTGDDEEFRASMAARGYAGVFTLEMATFDQIKRFTETLIGEQVGGVLPDEEHFVAFLEPVPPPRKAAYRAA